MKTITYDIETITEEPPEDDQFPPLHDHIPVVVSYLIVNKGECQIGSFSAAHGDGWDIDCLAFFQEQLQNTHRLITWNGSNFDVPLLMHWAAFLNVPFTNIKPFLKRYDKHWDMRLRWSNFSRARFSLDGFCKRLGLKGKHDIDGSQVREVWGRGEYDRVVRYCQEDVFHTYLTYLRYMKVILGADTDRAWDIIINQMNYPLRGTSIEYEDPTEFVAEDDWD